MATSSAYTLLLCLLVCKICHFASGSVAEDFVDERECPFMCKCSGYEVNCTNINFFPDNIPKETQGVFFINSTFDHVPLNAFLYLENLNEIHFIESKITRIRACSFAELSNMETISFVETRIYQIESNAFSNLRNITNIRFAKSRIEQMLSFAFHNFKFITRLDFFDTEIATIHPYAMLTFDYIEEFGIFGCTMDQFLRDGFSRFTNIGILYMIESSIKEWQCGSLGSLMEAGVDFTVSKSVFTCDCKLAWLWTKHSNSSILAQRTNICAGTRSSLPSVDLNQVCPNEKSRDLGCPPLLPSTPHTCSRSFDSPKEPVEKVTYPSFFSRTTTSSSRSSSAEVTNIILSMIWLMEWYHLLG